MAPRFADHHDGGNVKNRAGALRQKVSIQN